MKTTTNNDFLFSQVGTHVHVSDVSAVGSQVAKFTLEKGCVAQRARENEASNMVKHSDAYLSVQCDGHSRIVNGAGETVFKTESKGADVAKLFAKTGSKHFIRMLADLQV